MNPLKTSTDKPLSAEQLQAEPLLDAICLLPEFPAMDLNRDGRPDDMLKKHRELHQFFGRRFTQPFTVTTMNGLVRLGDPFIPSIERYESMAPEKRHTFLNALRGQLTIATRHRLQIVCLVGGVLLQGMRRLDFPLHIPCTAMSPRMRRNWLAHRIVEPSSEVWARLTFGTQPAPLVARGMAPRKKGNPAVSA